MLTESQVLANEIERVNPLLPTLFDRDDKFYSTIEKRNVEKVSARDMKVPLELRPGGIFGHFDPDGGDLGLGDGPTFDKATIPVMHLKIGIQWTKKSEWATDDSRKAVLNTFRHLLAKGMAEYRRSVEALCMTAGDGVLGTVSAVANAGGVDTVTLGTDGFGARLLRYGQPVNYYNSALTVNRTAGAEKKIQYLDNPTKTIKTPTTAGLVATDKVVVAGLSATPPVSIYGVPYHHNGATSGTWLGLDRATIPEIRGNRVNAGTAALALPYARQALSKLGDRLGNDDNTVKRMQAWMHPAQRAAYEELGMNVTVINQGSEGGKGLDLYYNQDNMRMAGVPIKTSYMWDKTRIDFIVPDAWGRAEMHPVEFYSVEGRKIFELRGASGGVATSLIYYIVGSFNIFMGNPVAGAYIDGLTVPAGYP
jgi:hypothetical protein